MIHTCKFQTGPESVSQNRICRSIYYYTQQSLSLNAQWKTLRKTRLRAAECTTTTSTHPLICPCHSYTIYGDNNFKARVSQFTFYSCENSLKIASSVTQLCNLVSSLITLTCWASNISGAASTHAMHLCYILLCASHLWNSVFGTSTEGQTPLRQVIPGDKFQGSSITMIMFSILKHCALLK